MPDGGISKNRKPTTPNHALQHGWALSVMRFIFNDTSLQASFYLYLDKVGRSVNLTFCLRINTEIYTFVKHIACILSGSN